MLTRWCTTTCPRWTTTICAAAGRPATGNSTKPRPFWLATPSEARREVVEDDADRAAACCAELARAAGPEALVGGQADDLAAEFRRVGLERLEAIHRRKTAALFRASLTLGAISAGADHAQRDALLEYGEALGLAFQIVDDLLDVSGQEQAVGKRLGKDRSRGKVTYPALLGVAESRRRADALVARAVAALELFGERGRPLRELAESMGRRTS
ncbi:MAG TPA: polyprenyl synthetase family protein [Lacipirellulaceae bacterium]|nr:polyprenyl synthetase family protein [Lacipirellulaceae bacterium]